MNRDALVAAAIDRAGADDFGPDSYAEGLDVLVTALNTEAQLNELGEVSLSEQIITALVNRLQVTAWAKQHPPTTQAPVERPNFIIGLPRTGTTLLSYLLHQDPQFRSLMRFESQSSIPPPTAATFTTDPRIEATRQAAAMLDLINPGFKAIHYEAPDGPTECVTLLAQDFKSIMWETLANIPSYSEWLLATDRTPAYQYHRLALQVLQSEAPGRWSLKSPEHRAALNELLATYPDATFVVTVRDPATVLASTCSLVRSLSGTFTDADHSDYITKHWAAVLEELNRRVDGVRGRDPATNARFLDVDYDELVADPVAVARQVYDHIGAELTDSTVAAMRAYVAENQQHKHGRHTYTV